MEVVTLAQVDPTRRGSTVVEGFHRGLYSLGATRRRDCAHEAQTGARADAAAHAADRSIGENGGMRDPVSLSAWRQPVTSRGAELCQSGDVWSSPTTSEVDRRVLR